MTTVTKTQGVAAVDGVGGVSGEELLARVLDDATVASLAEQARGRVLLCWVRVGCCSS